MRVGMDEYGAGDLHAASLAQGLCQCQCSGDCCASFWCSTCQTTKLHSMMLGDQPPKCCTCCNLPTGIFWAGALVGNALVS